MTLAERPLDGATVIFDLDGTLVDSAPDIAAALNHTLALEGRPPVNRADILPMIGRGSRYLISMGLSATGGGVDETRLDGLQSAFIAYYADHIADNSAPFPGVEETLDRFRDVGATLGVCTNKREILAERLLQATGLRSYFKSLIGADTIGIAKPDAAPLLAAIERAGGDAAHALMIGDSGPDVDAARNAGVPVIVVTFGYAHVPPQDLGGDLLVETFPAVFDAAVSLLRATPP